jgi:four helix bundle protein
MEGLNWLGVRGLRLYVFKVENYSIMPTVQKFEDLEIWQLARKIEQFTFEQTQKDPLSKDYKLKSQMNDSSSSIMSNIAEGFGRGSRLEFVNFLSFAKGSASELQSQYYNCLDRKYLLQESFNEVYQMIEICCKKTSAFIAYLNQSEKKGQKFQNRKTNP